MASPLEDVTDLLAGLAFRLGPPHGGGGGASSSAAGDSLSASISSLVAALNPGAAAASGTRVLDAALSLMCFDSLEVAP